MPELPEVETVRRGIERMAVGRRIARVEVGRERTVRRTSREALIDGLSGTTITHAGRRGKYLLCSLDSGEQMMIHLRMSGRVLIADAGAQRLPHTHVVLHLEALGNQPPCELWFVDPRTFGEVVVFDPNQLAEQMPELIRLGIDPLVDEFTPEILRQRFAGKRGNLKGTLLNQSVIAGIGNIYADEALFLRKIHPQISASRIRELKKLWQAIIALLERSITSGGSSIRNYVNASGEAGTYAQKHLVYGKTGEPCSRCGTLISRIVLSGRATHFCPSCQPRS